MAVAARFLGNIKVSRKLGIGFGFLLLAVLAVAFVGYTSNNILVDRLDTTRLIGTLNDAAQDMRLSEKQYEASADQAALEVYRTQLSAMQAFISKALLLLTSKENQQALTQLQASTASYDQKVNRLVDTDKSTSGALKPLGKL
ncbi:Methyl-accepting chemotaxis protein [Pseudomonas amygdali pv. mori]|uniref:Methyl-accepting chemotaxis protein n=1 Tax=Pseudomonas amygdali pv. mori TaxID=34065 RepID=A0A0P9UNA1_PSEA0|nr:Methyl-accepting chemotaxis protein [Pseudomonas amygdali pv. mori]